MSSLDVTGMVLAAGLSTRMGGFPKPLLHIDGDRFVERIVDTLDAAGASSVVVLGYEHEEVLDRADLAGADWRVNDDYESGMLSSVQCGVRYAQERAADGALLWPVDFPLPPAAVVSRLIERLDGARESGTGRGDGSDVDEPDVVVPVADGHRGHPALFARSTFEKLLDAPPDEGARAVVYDDATTVAEVPCDDRRVLVDIDTPAEYWDAVKTYS